MLAPLILFVHHLLRPQGKISFLGQLKPGTSVLDVGCGNNSPHKIKSLFPSLHYTGIDVEDYRQTKPLLSDRYILTTSKEFVNTISQFKTSFDAIISSHNIEHCEDRECTFQAMLDALKPGGILFLSFPCEASIHFPNRTGTLNYFDDSTHQAPPPDFGKFIAILEQNHFDVLYQAKHYQPFLLSIFGFLLEPLSKMRKKVLRGTWEYYGFESIIWARKRYVTP